MDGARLRCRVAVPTSDATPNDYYSDAVTLEISLDSTETSLSPVSYTHLDVYKRQQPSGVTRQLSSTRKPMPHSS